MPAHRRASARAATATGSAADEFEMRLRALGVSPQLNDTWLRVGKPTRVAGWKLHVSATATNIDLLFERVLPCLIDHGAPFKIVSERAALVQLNAGNFGERQIGKVLTIYPHDDNHAVALAGELIERTRGVVGPTVATDLHLGEAIYARYGSIRPRIGHDRFGTPTELIPDGLGNWITDLRPVPFRCPPGIVVPFPAASAETERADGWRLLAGRYLVTDVLHPGLAGSVFRAIDLRGAGGPTGSVLKQARPHCSADVLGRDRRARLRHEGTVVARLRGLPGIAPAGDYFEEGEIGYLPVTYVKGQAFGELVRELVAGRSWRCMRAQAKRRLLGYAAQLVRCLSSAHARGVIHRDVTPGNVWIGADDQVYLLDWELAHVEGSEVPKFRLGTPGFSDLSLEQDAPARRDDWQSCGRLIAFMLTGLNPTAVVHGRPHELATRLGQLTGLHDAALIELLARTLADEPSGELEPATLLRALDSTQHGRTVRRRRRTAPLFTMKAHESVLTEGLERLTAGLRLRLEQLRVRRAGHEAAAIDAHAGIAGLLYVLAAAHRAQVATLDAALAERAVHVLTAGTPVTPDLPGLVHGSAGRALAVAAAVQAGCVSPSDELHMHLARGLAGRLDWPDFTHGAAGQGFAALACAQRLGVPELAAGASACAAYLMRTQDPAGAWTLPEGVSGASGERFTGFAHGAAGIMGFLGSYSAFTGDAAADAAWRRAEGWLIGRARRGRGRRWQWPQSDSNSTAAGWWCHGAPGIALGWLCVAQTQGVAVIAEDYLRGALESSPPKLRGESVSQCHGLAGVGEVYLEAHRVLNEGRWRERAADIADVLVALFRRRSRQPWQRPPDAAPAEADGLMLGTAGILHFLLRHQHPAAVPSAPLLV